VNLFFFADFLAEFYLVDFFTLPLVSAVLRIRIMIRMFLGHPDPDPLVPGTDPDPAPDPSIVKQK
jgi:hypothetical protein